MSITVELIFTGIVGFIHLNNGTIAAVMPNAMHDPMHPHIPWVMVSKENRDPSREFDKVSSTGDKGAWKLNPVSLSIATAVSGPVRKVDEGEYGETPGGNHEHSVHWIASFRKIQPQAAVKPEYLQPGDEGSPPLPPRKSLWFVLPAGSMRTGRSPKCVWDLKATSNSSVKLRQALAQEVIDEVTIPDADSITLITRDLASGEVRELKLPLNGKKSISITFGNTQEGDIFPSDPSIVDPDEHFQIYYRMLDGVSGDQNDWPIPHRADKNCREPKGESLRSRIAQWFSITPESRRAGGGNCPPAMMN